MAYTDEQTKLALEQIDNDNYCGDCNQELRDAVSSGEKCKFTYAVEISYNAIETLFIESDAPLAEEDLKAQIKMSREDLVDQVHEIDRDSGGQLFCLIQDNKYEVLKTWLSDVDH